MSEAGRRMIAGAIEMVEVARGEKPAVSIYHNGHRYVPESTLSTAREEGRREGLEEAAAFLESQSAKSSVPELTAYRTWAYEVRKLARKIPERDDNSIPERT